MLYKTGPCVWVNESNTSAFPHLGQTCKTIFAVIYELSFIVKCLLLSDI
jgi:hypothetical protein